MGLTSDKYVTIKANDGDQGDGSGTDVLVPQA